MNAKLLIVLTCLSVGCAAGMALQRTAAAQSFDPSPSAPKWQQFCEGYSTYPEMNDALRRNGASGWELVTNIANGSYPPWLCYRRSAP